jgi:hypothetical protein
LSLQNEHFNPHTIFKNLSLNKSHTTSHMLKVEH